MLATISDRKFGVSLSDTSSLISYCEPDIVTAQDYYPFGMMSRVALPNSGVPYRFGFNGKLNDNEVKGLGNFQDYGMREYDPRIGRMPCVDPLTTSYPWYTPYQFAGNNPIKFVDRDGLEPGEVDKYWENQPLIDMTNAPAKGTNAAGIPRNGVWAAKQQFARKPEMFSPENQFLIFKRGVMPIVDEQWVKYNPTHAEYMGDKMLHHHIDGQENVALIPVKLNREKFSELHDYYTQKGGSIKGANVKGMMGGAASIIGTVSMFNWGNPDSWINGFSGGEQPEDYVGKVKKDFMSGAYVEINKVSFEYSLVYENGKQAFNSDGSPKTYISKRTVTGTLYSNYIWDEDAGQYRGVDKIRTQTEEWNYDQKGNRQVSVQNNLQ